MTRFKIDPRIRSLIIAAMIILLCLVYVTSATYALFTYSTEDGKIGINTTSGNLEVDIIDATDDPKSLVGDVLDFDADGNHEIWFEPGSLYYTEGFRIENKGDISLKFIVYITGEDNYSIELTEREPIMFSEAFDAWITTDPTGRTGMVELDKFEGYLEAKHCSDIYFLVFKMKETAGDLFQDRAFSGIGITVTAVQGNGYIK